MNATPIPGTENADTPFFSADGLWVGFWQFTPGKGQSELRKVPIAGGPVVPLCQAPMLAGASWGSHGQIVFALHEGAGLCQVAAEGGMPRELTKVEAGRGEYGHRLPHVLPNGEAVLFTILKASRRFEDAEIAVLSMKTGERKVLVKGATDARYVPSGHLVYARQGTLMARRFDVDGLNVAGGEVGVLDDVMQDLNTPLRVGNSAAAQFTVSASGTLAFVPGGISPDSSNVVVWVDRRGAEMPLSLSEPRGYSYGLLSPDAKRAVFWAGRRTSIYDLERGTLSPLGIEAGIALPAIWHPDSQHLTFQSAVDSFLYSIAADGSGPAERLPTNEQGVPLTWSPDRRTLLFVKRTQEGNSRAADIWALSFGDGSITARPYLETSSTEEGAVFSPDGHYVAYESNISGRNEVYVQPFPGPGPRILVSTNGGTQPSWANKSQELFYWELGPGATRVMAVNVTLGDTFTAGMPRRLFEVNTSVYRPGATELRRYDVTPDGQRFLMFQDKDDVAEPAITHIVVVQNWTEELKRLVPTN